MPTQCEIQTCINNLTSSSDLTEMVILAAETNDVTVDRSIPVAETCNLPDLALGTISVGTVFFVQSLCIPVVAGVGSWMTLDNRVLRQDYAAGEIWSWGRADEGQLGNNCTTSRSSPVSVVGGFTDWCQISAGGTSGGGFGLGVRQNGTAWAWGTNSSGQLGDNSAVSKSSPVSVVGGFCDWCQVSGGGNHSLGVRTGGTAWAWGNNSQGRLGNNTTSGNQSSPVSVVGGFTDWCQVSAGLAHSLGVRTGGTAWAWGCNTCGILGDNTTVSKSSPVSVVGGFTDWCQISAGNQQSLAVRQNGTAWAWGCNGAGRLGDNTVVNKSSPVSVVGGFTDWCQVSTGLCFSLGVRQNGTAWGWGVNNFGVLGTNSTVSRSSPVSVVGGFTDWCQISAGECFSLAVRTNGTAWAWGCNTKGQLGDNTTVSKSSPVSVVGGFTDWCQVSARTCFSLGLRRY
jgi:alpha-tubulin suppressor-like RCC1 family protein